MSIFFFLFPEKSPGLPISPCSPVFDDGKESFRRCSQISQEYVVLYYSTISYVGLLISRNSCFHECFRKFWIRNLVISNSKKVSCDSHAERLLELAVASKNRSRGSCLTRSKRTSLTRRVSAEDEQSIPARRWSVASLLYRWWKHSDYDWRCVPFTSRRDLSVRKSSRTSLSVCRELEMLAEVEKIQLKFQILGIWNASTGTSCVPWRAQGLPQRRTLHRILCTCI